MLRRVVVPLVIVLAAVLLPARPAAAHPLDEYLHAAYLTPGPDRIVLRLDLSPGVLVAPAALAALDPDGDRRISGAESGAYADRVLATLDLRADGRPLTLRRTAVEVPPYLTVRAGYGTIRLTAEARGAPAADGAHELFFRNGHAPAGATYQVNTLATAAATVDGQRRDAAQRESRIGYRLGTAGATPAAAAPGPDGDRLGRLLESGVLLALALAALLGALHALTPGHAKTLMAAYLVGSGGTVRNALTLGAVVTVTHTASVVVIGLVALFASRFLVPGILVPALQTASGVLVLVIGLHLLVRRLRHHHHGHTHGLPAGGVTPRGLLAMGLSGGLVPCPEALGVLVLAVGVNRTVFGLGLILSFSAGLAAVLMGIGILLIRSRDLAGRFARAGARWTRALPLVSAVVVTGLGAGLLIQGVT